MRQAKMWHGMIVEKQQATTEKPVGIWHDWKKVHPEPGLYVFVRDLDAPDIWEIGWVMGVKGNTKVAVVNDPTMNQFTFDQWQLVPLPVE
jgi:hypothetical protein